MSYPQLKGPPEPATTNFARALALAVVISLIIWLVVVYVAVEFIGALFS